ncbi:hypothetical protein BGZ63DRAFT_417674 [Mariannaea sp. PMI_226]|nr:hypothetical protein BGZ63DRAFT_417674 [Mariannaea sp. PMI_226]
MPSPPASAGRSGRASSPILPVAIISLIFFFAANSMTGQAHRNGYIDLIYSTVDDDRPRFLPGSDRLLLRHYFGIPAVDRLLAMLNVVFANVADGSSPELSLFAFYFATQMVPFFLVVMIESQRVWSGFFFNPVLWGLLMQFLGFGVIAPVFFVIHLLMSSKHALSDTVRLKDPTSLHVVVPSILLGFAFISALVAYPFSQANVRQWCLVFWQMFPVYVIGLQTLFTGILKRTSIGGDTFTPKAQLDRAALSHAYAFAWNVAVIGQLCTIGIIATSAFIPSLYPAGVAESLTLEKIFVPGSPHSWKPYVSPAAAIHDLLRYDIYSGSVAAIIWAVYLLSQVRPVLSTSEERKNLGMALLRSMLSSGPGGTLVALLQHRDETVLAAELKADKLH